MIRLTDGKDNPVWVNSDQIKYIRVRDDRVTLLFLDNELMLRVRDTPEEIRDYIHNWKWNLARPS